MNEASKTKRIWTEFELGLLQGEGIDIGCGPDPVFPGVTPFDLQQGDANRITKYVHRQFDFVFSSHCLEHMADPRSAIQEWWRLVKPGGVLFVIVPDEDLYEQGVFPSRFNPDHKATFTIAKRSSWSPVSHNLLDLARELPGAELLRIELHDRNYDRSLARFGPLRPPRWAHWLNWLYLGQKTRTGVRLRFLERYFARTLPLDQTVRDDTFAQIQCIVRKAAGGPDGGP